MEFFFVCVAVFMVVTFRMSHITDGLAFRPFSISTPSGLNCSTEQRLSDVGCPCTLPNIPCAANTSFCVDRICQFSKLVATPTISSYTIPCGLDLGLHRALPGLNISFAGGVAPVVCNTVVGLFGNTVPTVFAISSFLDNDPTNPDNQIPDLPAIGRIDNVTGQFLPFPAQDPRIPATTPTDIPIQTAISILLADTDPDTGFDATLFTQILSGYCIDARGVRSNTFTFALTVTLCPGATGVVVPLPDDP